jgi:hypothetical protein
VAWRCLRVERAMGIEPKSDRRQLELPDNDN